MSQKRLRRRRLHKNRPPNKQATAAAPPDAAKADDFSRLGESRHTPKRVPQSSRRPWRELASIGLPIIAAVAMLFGGFQAYYSREQHLTRSADARHAANTGVQEAGNVLLAASRMTLPLPTPMLTAVDEARRTIATAQQAGADSVTCRELTSLADVLMLRCVEEADASLQALRQELPARPLPYLGLGISYFAQEKYADSITILTSGLAHTSVTADLLDHRARVFLRERKLDLAHRDASYAVSQEPNLAFSHFVLGLVLRAENLKVQAAGAFATACRLEPTWYEAHLALASMQIQEGHLNSALKHLDAAISSAPEEAALHLTRAAVLNALGEHQATSSALDEARDLMPVQYSWQYGDYTRIFAWVTDLPELAEFNGEFLLQYQEAHPG